MRLKIFLFILFCSTNGYGQNYLNESSKWYTIEGDTFDKWYFLEKNQVVGDTLINDTTYLKIQISKDHLNINPNTGDTITYYTDLKHIRLLREEGKRFYTRSLEEDKLLFDFNLSLEDTIMVNGFPTEVIYIDTFYTESEIREVFYLDMGVRIYEGIGTSQGIFHEISFPVGEYFAKLKCYFYNGIQYSINDSPIFWDISVESCDSLVFDEIINSNQNLLINDRLIIYPNPFLSELFLEFKDPSTQEGLLTIKDINGRTILNKKLLIQGQNETVNLSDLDNGIYILQLQINDEDYIKKIIKL